MELRKPSYISQISLHLKNSRYEQAYTLAKDFTQKYPEEMVAHYLLASSAFWAKKYEEAVLEGSKAFNKSSSDDDMLACTIITASAYYELKKYEKGLHLLQIMEERKKTANLERLLFLFSMAVNDGKEAAVHLDELYNLNQTAAEELVAKYFK